MRIAKRDFYAFVSNPVGNRHRTVAHVDQQRYMRMPLWYNRDKSEKPRSCKGFEGFWFAFSSFSK